MMHSALEGEGLTKTWLSLAQGFACSGGSVSGCRKHVLRGLSKTKINSWCLSTSEELS